MVIVFLESVNILWQLFPGERTPAGATFHQMRAEKLLKQNALDTGEVSEVERSVKTVVLLHMNACRHSNTRKVSRLQITHWHIVLNFYFTSTFYCAVSFDQVWFSFTNVSHSKPKYWMKTWRTVLVLNAFPCLITAFCRVWEILNVMRNWELHSSKWEWNFCERFQDVWNNTIKYAILETECFPSIQNGVTFPASYKT